MTDRHCPTREDLLAYHVGSLPEDAAAAVIDHLSRCRACQAAVESFREVDDPVMAGLRRPDAIVPFSEEPEHVRALVRAKAVSGGSASGRGKSSGSSAAKSGGGRQLGEYKLLAKLGQGGMGAVYKALHTKLQREVALKVLPKGHLASKQAIARFEREMVAVAKLDHPNVVRAYDAREIGSTRFLVMELVEGLDLSRLVERLGPLPVADACELIRQAALGLQCAHENGLVHRDVKPSNLMLTRDGTVKVLDLGLARIHSDQPVGEITDSGQFMGTADYTAPEQASDSRSADVRADVYSLGCTLYKLLVGEAPFAGPDYPGPIQKLMAHLEKPVPPVRERRPDVPESLAFVLDRMLAKDPEGRFDTPGQVADQIGGFAAGADLSALLARAEGKPKPPIVKPASTEAPLASAQVDTHVSPMSSLSSLISRLAKRPWKPWEIATGVAVAVLVTLVAWQMVIHVRKDGRETVVRVPAGAEVTIDRDGNADVRLPTGDTAVRAKRDELPTPPPSRMTGAAAQRGRLRSTLTGHTNRVESLAFSRDGSMLASGSSDRTAKVWDLATGRLMQTLEEDTFHLRAVEFNRDGSTLFTGSNQGGISLWDVQSGEFRRNLEGHRSWINSIALSPDGKTLASTGREGTLCLWDADMGSLLRTIDPADDSANWFLCIAMSPDGSSVAAGGRDNLVRLWDPDTGELLRTFTGHTDWVWEVAFSPDGATLVSASDDTTLKLWNVSTGELRQTLTANTTRVRAVAVSPDGSTLASGHSDAVIRLWHLATGELQEILEGHADEIDCVAFSPDGSLLASGSQDNTIKLWQLRRGKLSPPPDADRPAAESGLSDGGMVETVEPGGAPAPQPGQAAARDADAAAIEAWCRQAKQLWLERQFARFDDVVWKDDFVGLMADPDGLNAQAVPWQTTDERIVAQGESIDEVELSADPPRYRIEGPIALVSWSMGRDRAGDQWHVHQCLECLARRDGKWLNAAAVPGHWSFRPQDRFDPNNEDHAAIRRFFEDANRTWIEADPERIREQLHPNLRAVLVDPRDTTQALIMDRDAVLRGVEQATRDKTVRKHLHTIEFVRVEGPRAIVETELEHVNDDGSSLLTKHFSVFVRSGEHWRLGLQIAGDWGDVLREP